jgi:hypothetical protein
MLGSLEQGFSQCNLARLRWRLVAAPVSVLGTGQGGAWRWVFRPGWTKPFAFVRGGAPRACALGWTKPFAIVRFRGFATKPFEIVRFRGFATKPFAIVRFRGGLARSSSRSRSRFLVLVLGLSGFLAMMLYLKKSGLSCYRWMRNYVRYPVYRFVHIRTDRTVRT